MTSTLPVHSGSSDPITREKWKPLQWIEDGEEGFGPDEDNDGVVDDDIVFTTPNSYVERADWIYQYVSQFVTDNIAPSFTEKICDPEDAGNPTPIFQYVESWNEPNLPFPTPERAQVQFTPQEYAAMASCDFDGHEGTVLGLESSESGAGTYPIGIRNASPGVQFVMGAPFDIEYGSVEMDPGTGFGVWDLWVEPMYDWFVENRNDDEFIFDVLNFHHYSVSGPNTLDPGSDDWISPEEDLLRPRMAALVNQKNTAFGGILADREIWISEFGYDTNQNDPNGWDFEPSGFPANIPENVLIEQLQAQWISRSFLEFAAAGIDRAVVHDLNDVDDLSAWDKSTGLHTFTGDPKESWFHVFGMRNILEGYRYVADESINCDLSLADIDCNTPAANKCTRVYRFENSAGDNIWAVWSPTSCAIDAYEVDVNTGSGLNLSALRLGAPSIHGLPTPFNGTNGTGVSIDVSETPVFIIEEPFVPISCPTLTVSNSNISCSSVLINIDNNQEFYDQLQVWFGSPGTNEVLNFSALSGNMEQFIYNADGNAASILLTGLQASTEYTIAVFPDMEGGIPIDPSGDLNYCTITVTTNSDENINDICKIPIGDFSSITYNNDSNPTTVGNLFNNQEIDFCTGELHGETPEDAWINSIGATNGVTEVIIEFNQNYYIDQFYIFDMGDTGILPFEWDDNGTWRPFYDYLTNTTMDWVAIDNSNFNQPNTGIRKLRIRNQYDGTVIGNAIIGELFICGRPFCSIGTPTVLQECNDANFNLNSSGTDCAIASELTIQGNSEIETHVVNRNTFNYPASFFAERGSNQLIPGVSYSPEIETCSENTCTTEVVPFTVPATGTCVLNNEAINTESAFIGGCGRYTLPVDATTTQEVQVWLSHSGEFTSTTTHPLLQNTDVETMVLSVNNNPFIGNSISFTYDDCKTDVYLAYRYLSEDKSSPLYTLSLDPSSTVNNLAWASICACVTNNPDTPTPSFIIDNCQITDIVYDYLEAGQKLHHKEVEIPSTGANQLLHEELYIVTSADYTYDLVYPTSADKVDFRVKEANPWSTLDLTAVPCISTNDPLGGAKKEDENSKEADLTSTLRLYPNPAQGYLVVETTESTDLQLIGVDGKSRELRDLSTTRFGYRFSTAHLTAGVYFLRTINPTGEVYTEKFIVQQ